MPDTTADSALDPVWAAAAPMRASAPPDPVVAPTGPGWTFEVKWDGVRALARVDADGAVHLRSRNGNDLAGRYPGIVAAAVGEALAPVVGGSIVDGECVWFDPAGRPVFRGMRAGADVRLVVFDVLVWRGRDVRGLPLSQRVDLLDGVDLAEMTGGAWLPSARFTDGAALMAATAEQGLEGVLAKRLSGRYQGGVRSRDWVKLPHRTLTDVVVVGWVRAESGSGASSLVVADGDGVLLGTVGSGISGETGRAVAQVLGAVGRELPADALQVTAEQSRGLRTLGPRLNWCEPVLVAEVRHLGHTEGGDLRQPVMHRLRPDLQPEDLGGAAW